jgi:hypothetical protein
MAFAASLPRSASWLLLPVFAGLVLATATFVPCRAADGENYLVPTSDGYGIGECMHAGSDCGRVIADSWCEAHGHAHALAFGMAEDVTGAIQIGHTPGDSAPATSGTDIVIRCGD